LIGVWHLEVVELPSGVISVLTPFATAPFVASSSW
jgi:hypothetical protein